MGEGHQCGQNAIIHTAKQNIFTNFKYNKK
jgi:hypothetical protein